MVSQRNKELPSSIKFKKAFTLVEIMVAILLSTIVLSAAFMIWTRVSKGIARSHTRQILQNELRKAANYIQNDFKSIKYAEEGEADALTYNSSNTGFTMSFKKFKEISEKDENKVLSQDSIESIQYALEANVLIRKGEKTKILSSHCDSFSLERAEESEESLGEDYQKARNAKLNIELVGKMIVPGTNEEMYHVEKTSVVMRNEYYKVINQNYKSNFDIQGLNKDEVIKEGGEADIDLTAVPDKILDDMIKSWEDTIDQCKQSITDINQAINDTDSNSSFWSKAGAALSFLFGDNDEKKFQDLQKKLTKADSQEAVEEAIQEIQANIDEKEDDFCEKTYSGYKSLSSDDPKKLQIKKVYDMAVHDKTMEKYFEDLDEEQRAAQEKNFVSNHRVLELQSEGKRLIEIDENGNEIVEDLNDDEKKQEAAELLAIYNASNTSWMKDDDDETKIYRASKSILESGNTKLELIKVRDEAISKKQEVQDEIDRRKNS